MTVDEAVALLIRHYQHGLLDNVRTLCDAVLTAFPDHPVAALYRDRATRPAPVERPDRFTLLWRVDAVAREWSREWILRLLADLPLCEVIDDGKTPIPDMAVVVDQKLDRDKTAAYRRAFNAGHRFGLLHLSDEGYADDRSAYDYCDFVLRQYWSVLHRGDPRVMTVPLGWKSGLNAAGAERPAAERPLIWSFAGDPNKSSRPAMLAALQDRTPHRSHLTDSFFDPVALGVADYQALLNDSVFIPCPAGFINLDSFRVYEALECGCIPIVERRPGFDYFLNLFGPHPMITVDDWEQAERMIASLSVDPAGLELRRRECLIWWRETAARTAAAAAALARAATAVEPWVPPAPLRR